MAWQGRDLSAELIEAFKAEIFRGRPYDLAEGAARI